MNMIGAVGFPSSPLPHPAPTIQRRERHGGIELIDGVLRILRTIPIHRIEGIVGVELIDRIGGVAGTSLVVREASLAGWRSRESPLVKFMSFRLLRLWHRAAILGPVGTPLKYQIDRQAPPSTIGQYSCGSSSGDFRMAEELRKRSSVFRQEQENFCAHAMGRGHHITTIRLFGLEQVIWIPCRYTVRGQLPAIRLQCGQPRIARDALGE